MMNSEFMFRYLDMEFDNLRTCKHAIRIHFLYVLVSRDYSGTTFHNPASTLQSAQVSQSLGSGNVCISWYGGGAEGRSGMSWRAFSACASINIIGSLSGCEMTAWFQDSGA